MHGDITVNITNQCLVHQRERQISFHAISEVEMEAQSIKYCVKMLLNVCIS